MLNSGFKKGPILWAFLITSVAMSVVIYSFIVGRDMATRFSPLVDASMEIKLEAAISHLWFEEAISGDRSVDITDIWSRLDRSRWYAVAMLDGGENDEGKYIPLKDQRLRAQIEETIEGIDAFRDIGELRWSRRGQSGIGAGIEQEFDAKFEEFMRSADGVETALQYEIVRQLNRYRFLQTILIIMVVLIGGLVGSVLYHYEKNQRMYIQNLEQQEEDIRQALHSIGDGVVATDVKGRVTRMNPIAEKLTGWTIEQAAGKELKEVFNIVNTLSREMVENPVERVLENGETVGLANHTTLIARDKTEYQIADSAAPIRNAENEITGVILVFRDVSEQDVMREALLESSEALTQSNILKSAVIDHSPIGITVRDAQGTLLLANQAWRKIWNISQEEFGLRTEKKKTFSFTARDNYLGEHLAEVQKVYEEGGEYFIPVLQPLRPELGKAEWISQFFYAIQDESGQVAKVVILTEDISERRNMESLLIDSEDRYRSLSEAAFDAIFISEKGICIEQNSVAEKMFGYTTQEAIGMLGTDWIVPEDRALVMKNMLEGNTEPYEVNALCKDGRIFPAQIQGRMMPYKGREVRVTGVSDISRRKLAEEALTTSEKKFRAFTNQSVQGITLADMSGNYTFVNPAFCEMVGYSEAELLAMTVFNLGTPGQEPKLFNKSISSLEGIPIQVELYRKDGTNFMAEVIGKKIDIGETQSYMGIVRDISTQIEASEARISLENQLRQSQKLEAVGTMVGGIAHDFNNILQSMFLYGEVVSEQLPDDQKLKSDFQHILNDGARARSLVQQILTFSRKSAIELTPQPIHEIVLDALNFERASSRANIEIIQEIDLNCGPILCDKTQIHQIVINLCNNAKHAMGEAGGVLTVTLAESAEHDDNSVTGVSNLVLQVSDTGPGMDAGILSKIFDPFYTTKAIGEGTGLGLSVIHGIVELMQGRINVSSEPGRGTTFRIEVPLAAKSPENEVPLPPQELQGSTASVLLVDDEKSILTAGKAVLERRGYQVDVASDGDIALEKFSARPEKYNIIITDLSMNRMSGIDLTRAIRKLGHSIPIILSSGNLESEEINYFTQEGISLFLHKPWSADQLIQCIAPLITELAENIKS